ncbi:MAG: PilZ domain-containing protein [Desulfosalsimonadaceae bacterium]
MTAKVFVEHDNSVTISCPKCTKTKSVDSSMMKGHTTVRVKCPCGNVSKIQLEYRRQYRKKTELPGFYRVVSRGEQSGASGFMTVIDLSRNGIRLKFKDIPVPLDVGERLNIKFTLDDKNQTLVNRSVVVRNIHLPCAGAVFHRTSDTDNVIGFYLLQ